MIIWIDYFYMFIIGAALLSSVMGLWFTAVMPGVDRWGKRFFLQFFGVLMLGSFSCLVGMVIFYWPVTSPALKIVLTVECLILSLPVPMLTAYLLHCCGEDFRTSRLIHTAAGLWAVYAVLVLSSLFTDAFFFITPDMNYSRGHWYPLMLLPLFALALLNLVSVIQRRKQLSRRTFRSFLIALLPMVGVLFAQQFIDITPLVDICYVLSGECMYSLILSGQIELDLRQQRELAERQRQIADQRASIMVLQMRPHFIYNTLTSIYCLCSQDPRQAQRIVLDFTTYLRKNFTAIVSATPIPFSSELEHARAYLAVEQARFASSLRVDYDTPHTWFRVPPLTLQPIVENAIKHGKDPYGGPFTISIRTRKTDLSSEIVVTDNGRGFTPVDDSEPHIALENIRQRLALMCGGSLTIAPNDGGGTVVTITIPDSPAGQ